MDAPSKVSTVPAAVPATAATVTANSVVARNTADKPQCIDVDDDQLAERQPTSVNTVEVVKSTSPKFRPETVVNAPPLKGEFPRMLEATGAAAITCEQVCMASRLHEVGGCTK